MNSLYTPEVRNFIRAQAWPSDLIWEVLEIEPPEEPCLKFKMFRDNINSLSSSDKLRLTSLINDTLSRISRSGIPIYVWVAEGGGRVGERRSNLVD